MFAEILLATALLVSPCRYDVEPPTGHECAEVQPSPTPAAINPDNVLPGSWFTPTGTRE